jgi:hypothetical protein
MEIHNIEMEFSILQIPDISMENHMLVPFHSIPYIPWNSIRHISWNETLTLRYFLRRSGQLLRPKVGRKKYHCLIFYLKKKRKDFVWKMGFF